MTAEQAPTRPPSRCASFWLRFAREKDIRLFLEMSQRPRPARPADLDLKVLIPAYILSELKTGFQIGAVLFLPFLVIDLVVASVTLSVGMVQLPPVMISAPFKILLFVLVDGWNLVVGSLMKSFYQMTSRHRWCRNHPADAAGGVLAGRAAAGDRLCGGHRHQPGADRDLHAGQRLQHHSAAGRVSCVGYPAADAVDDRRRMVAYTATVAGRSGPVCPLTSRWASGTLLRISAGAGAGFRSLGIRAAARLSSGTPGWRASSCRW